MKIILTIECETPGDVEEARGFVESLTQRVEQRQYQHFPGAVLHWGTFSVWVSGVELTEAS